MLPLMAKSETFRLNYYVGAMLAQGGNLWFDDSKIVFSPTSAIDRALGASDVEIPFLKIQNVEFKGDMTRMFHIKTADKLHRFHGSQAKVAWENLATTLKARGMQPVPKPSDLLGKPVQTGTAKPAGKTLACQKCSGRLETNFLFCPFCGTRVLPS